MIKVYRRKMLEERDGKWYWKESRELFSGVMADYDFELNMINGLDNVKAEVVEDGVVVQPYRNEYIAKYKLVDHAKLNHITAGSVDYLLDEETNIDWAVDTYDKKSLVTGSAYGLLGNYLEQEFLYIEGREKIVIDYFESGEMKYFDYNERDEYENYTFHEEYKWHEDGSYKFVGLAFKDRNFEMKCPKPNLLEILSIDKFYYENMERFKEESFVGVIEDKSYFKQLRAGVGNDEDAEEYKRLLLYYDGIDDEIFQNIWSNGGMEEVEELTIWWNNLTKHSFYKLLDLPNLKEVSMKFEKETMSEDAIESGKFVAKELKSKGVKVDLEIDDKKREV